jgi:hypothetical protein
MLTPQNQLLSNPAETSNPRIVTPACQSLGLKGPGTKADSNVDQPVDGEIPRLRDCLTRSDDYMWRLPPELLEVFTECFPQERLWRAAALAMSSKWSLIYYVSLDFHNVKSQTN